jgi:hypothetical protein
VGLAARLRRYLLYDNVALGGVMALAMLLNMLLAAGMGVAIPYPALEVRQGSGGRLVGPDHRLHRLGRLFHFPGTRDAVPDLIQQPTAAPSLRGSAPPMRMR